MSLFPAIEAEMAAYDWYERQWARRPRRWVPRRMRVWILWALEKVRTDG